MHKFICIAFTMIIFSGCKELILPDVSNVKVTVLTPRDSLISDASIQSFFWETSEEDTPCRLQIVRPNFDTIDYFIEDTLVNSNRFELSLPSNIYSWRIRPENEQSHGDYQYFQLIVDSSSNLTSFKVQILSPLPNQYLSFNDSINITWTEISEAQQFEYIINNISESTSIQGITTNTNVDIPLGEGLYFAEVRAQGAFTNSAFSEINFAIDTSAPNSPELLFPSENQIFTTTQIGFSWSSSNNEITPETDTLYLYLDALGQNIIAKREISINSLDTILTRGIYYWSVSRFDQVGLKSAIVTPQRFFIQ